MEVIMTVAYVNIESAAQGTEDDKLAELLRETAMHHDGFEKATPSHNWWNWYARDLSARQHGAPRSRPTPPRTGTWRRYAEWLPDEV
jgi:hypothetical protein